MGQGEDREGWVRERAGNGRDDVGREVGEGTGTGKGRGMTRLTVHQCWQVWYNGSTEHWLVAHGIIEAFLIIRNVLCCIGLHTCAQLYENLWAVEFLQITGQSCLNSPPHSFVSSSLSSPPLIIYHPFTPGSRPTFSTNPSHLRLFSFLGCLHDNGTGPDLSHSSVYF